MEFLSITQPSATAVAGLLSCLAVIASAYISSTIAKKNIELNRKQLKFNHELKLAEFRQKWIDNLRDTMAEFQAIGTHPKTDQILEKDFYKLGTKIQLLMNPADSEYDKLHSIMYEYYYAQTPDEKNNLDDTFVKLCQGILKREWDRLKSDLKNAEK